MELGGDRVKTAGDIIREINQKETQLPFFTKEGWLLLAGIGAIGGIIGATVYIIIISPFLR